MQMDLNSKTVTNMDEYISRFDENIQRLLEDIRKCIREAAPEAEEKISYQMPTFAYYGNLVHFAAYSGHIGFYPAPSGIEAFKDRLSQYKWAKGSVQFPIDKPMPFELISDIVRFRVQENAEKVKASAKRKK